MLLYRGELLLYLAVYVVYLIYTLSTMINLNDKILEIAVHNFTPGWSFLGRPRDNSNIELELWTMFVRDYWFWYFIHMVTSSLCQLLWPHRQSYGHAIVGAIAIYNIMHGLSVMFLSALLLSYYICSFLRSKVLLWILSGVWMYVVTWIKDNEIIYRLLDYPEYFMLIILLAWSVLRGCSFGMTRANDKVGDADDREVYSLKHFLGYTLYFPCLIYGPYLGYHRYAIAKATPARINIRDYPTHLMSLLLELLRVGFWWTVMQFLLHYLYIHYMMRDVEAVKLVQPAFSQYAIGYFMGQFFFLYYVITYGMGIAFARFDGLDPPNRPKCIGRIHYYSDMWKYFDQGLYEFLFTHIYCELCRKDSSILRKLLASTVTFTFVFVWHGCYMYVFIWSFLNLCCLVAEKMLRTFLESQMYLYWATRYLGTGGARRLGALLGSQLFIPSAMSNIYFMSGLDNGNYLMVGAYRTGIPSYLGLTICSYCFFQCCDVLLHVDKKTELKKN